ncbi:type I restriction modification DNA specificity domain protein [Helicobacter pylori GAM71Ai]|uniref:restriction endonuclease subunit S n=1 Tax=Helicobacter pylori TaxID=210 RepID=UPI0002B9D3B6|nr:restriction endonuclease subunit S [Helicobacter pylori]EMH35076.1 type I restriction modification DNA specificity domain protein [Helicobacter pylori GAM71Ai]
MDALTTPLPKAWQKVRLGTYKYRRGSFPQPYGNPQWYSDNGMPFVQVYDVGENFKLTQKTKQKISKIAQPMSVFVPKNSVIITLQGTIGRVALTQYDCYCDRTILIFDNNTLNDVNKYFFVLSLFTKFEEEKRKADGSIIKTITKQTLKDFEIPLPPLNEQIAIANVLSDVDHYLYSLDALILKKESVKKALSFELLSQRKRLKGFNQAWKKVRLGDIFFITAGGDLSKPHYSNTKQSDFNYPIYSNAIEKKGLYGYSSFFIIKNKSITITARGTMGVAFFRDYPYVPIGRLLVLQPKISNIDCRFYTEYINSKVKFNTEQTTIPQLTIPKVALCEIPLPPLNEQAAIANILSDLDNEIISLKNKKRQFENIKKALNHDLMSAKIRVLNK